MRKPRGSPRGAGAQERFSESPTHASLMTVLWREGVCAVFRHSFRQLVRRAPVTLKSLHSIWFDTKGGGGQAAVLSGETGRMTRRAQPPPSPRLG